MANVKKLGQYKDIEVSVERHTVTKEEVQQQIDAMVAQNSVLVDKEGDVENGDVTTIDFAGYKDGVAFDGGTASGYQLEIGSGSFIPGFEEQMIGMKKGETRDLNLKFPDNYGAADLAGAQVIFKVTVHNIQTKQQAQLNDEFVVSLGNPEMKTVEDLKNTMTNYLQAQYSQEFSRNVENAVFEVLLSGSEVEVDDSDVESALNQHISHIASEIAMQGIALDQYLEMMGMNEDMLKEQLKPSASQQAVFEAIIDEVAKVEGLETTDEEADQYIEMMAAQSQREKEELLKEIVIADLKRDFSRYKASQLIIQSAIVK